MQSVSDTNKSKKESENHLSSKFEDVLLYQQRLHRLQYDAGRVKINSQIFIQQIQKDLKSQTTELEASSLPLQKVYERVGLAICYNPFFIKDLILKYYIPFIPKQFKGQIQLIINIGTAFDALWWSSLAGAMILSWKKRNIKISFKQQISRNLLGLACLLGSQYLFKEGYFTPSLQKSFYKNIKYVDKIVEKHINMIELSKKHNQETQSKI